MYKGVDDMKKYTVEMQKIEMKSFEHDLEIEPLADSDVLCETTDFELANMEFNSECEMRLFHVYRYENNGIANKIAAMDPYEKYLIIRLVETEYDEDETVVDSREIYVAYGDEY